MSALPQHVHDLLTRLNETSRSELDLVRDLSDAIRRADDQLLKEVRSVSMLHELRREAIMTELQLLAQRLCTLPARDPIRMHTHTAIAEPATALDAPSPSTAHQQLTDAAPIEEAVITVESPTVGRAGDWRQAAQRIDEELAQYFGGPGPRH